MNDNNNNSRNDSRSLKEKWEELQGFHRAAPILLIALAAFIVVCYCTAENGILGKAISTVFMGLFSTGAWAIPVMLVIHALFYADDLERGRIPSRIIFSVVTTVIISMVEYAITFSSSAPDGDPLVYFAEQRAGGFIGSALAFLLVKIFAWWGLIIIAVAVFALYVAYFYAGSNSTVSKVFFTVLEYIARFLAVIERWIIDLVGLCKDAINEKKQKQIEDKQSVLADDDFFDVDNGMSSMVIKELGINKSKNPEEFEESPTLHAKVHIKSAVKESPAVKSDSPVVDTTVKPETEPKATQRKAISFDYNFDHLKPKNTETHETAPTAEVDAEEKKKQHRTEFGLDECAENVFTKDFDPYDFNTSEKIATRMSSKAPIREKIVPMYGEAVDINDITEDDVRRFNEKKAMAEKIAAERAFNEKRLREFEERKAALIKQSHAATSEKPVATPAPQPSERSAGAYTPTFTSYSNHSAKEDIFAVKENKIIERRAAEMSEKSDATYGSIETETSTDAPSAPSATVASATYAASSAPVREAEAVGDRDYSSSTPSDARVETATAPNYGAKPEFTSKTVAFNVSNDISHSPIESDSVQMTTRKYSDVTANAIAISNAIASKNPAYAISENVINGSFSYTVKGSLYENDDSADELDANDTPDLDKREDELYGAAEEFNTYDPLEDDEVEDFSEPETLDAERSMIEPDPRAFANTASSSDTVSYACESRDRGDISATFSLADDTEVEEYCISPEDGLTWTPECAEPIHLDDSSGNDAIDFTAADEDEVDFADATDEDGEADDGEIPPSEQNPDVINQRSEFAFLREEDEQKKAAEAINPTEAPKAEANPQAAPIATANAATPAPTAAATAINKPLPPAPVEEKKPKPAPDYSNYKFPGLDLLIPAETNDYDYTEETEQSAMKLINALADFGITVYTKGVDRGPRITRYEVVPAKGVRVNSIINLESDIALTLAATSIRMEAPIPGKSAIGIEIPNAVSSLVRLSELVDTAEFRSKKQSTTICLGKDVSGTPVFGDVESLPHLLVAGATGMGKSVCINACMLSMLYKARPDEIKFIMIDPKRVEFNRYNGIPHLLIPVVTENKQAAGALMWAVEEMTRRYKLMENMQVSNLDGYNRMVAGKPELGETLPRIVIVIDEFADLMMTVKDPVEDLVQILAQKARAAGIHLIIGTQRPDATVITGTIKSNIPGRISCKVASGIDSRTILDAGGAELLLDKGDMLYKSGALKLARVQGALVTDEELSAVLNFIKSQTNGETYDEEILNDIMRASQKCGGGKKSGSGADDDDEDSKDGNRHDNPLDDHQFLKAVDIALSQGQISTAYLQRRLSIGFGKAARFIDYMEDMGIVSEKNGAKPRNVLISRAEWMEKYQNVSIT